MIAWGYFAVSSDRQSEDLAQQESWARSVTQERGWTLARIFSKPGTGKHGPRKLLFALIAELKAAPVKPDVVLMNRLDRVGRGKVVDSQVALAEITSLGVQVFTREQGFVANESWIDELINAVRFATARAENEAKADRARSGHAEKRAKGLHAGHAPYGTLIKDGKPVCYEPEAAVIRSIFRRRLVGWGLHRITREVSRWAPPKTKPDGSLRPLKWATSTVGRMLNCPTYRDLLVPAQTFDTVQAMRTHPRIREAKYPWPLRGVVRCTCGLMLTTVRSGNASCRIRYYTCSNVAAHDGYPYHRADKLEAQFADLLRAVKAAPSLLFAEGPTDTKARDEYTALKREREQLETRRQRVWGLFEVSGVQAEVTRRLEELQRDAERIEARMAELERLLASEDHRTQTFESAGEVLAALSDYWDEVPESAQREVAKALAYYIGGLWCDPKEPGILKRGPYDANPHNSEQMRNFTSSSCRGLFRLPTPDLVQLRDHLPEGIGHSGDRLLRLRLAHLE